MLMRLTELSKMRDEGSHGAERRAVLKEYRDIKSKFKVEGDRWRRVLEVYIEGIDQESNELKGELEDMVAMLIEMKTLNEGLENIVVKKVSKLFAKLES